MEQTVLLGMSGGVDSAASVLLLQEQGFTVSGCTLQMYDGWEVSEGSCGSPASVAEAEELAKFMKIPFYVVNCQTDFRRCVMDDFVARYREGRTPNPCISCNRHIKFSGLETQADRLGIRYIATGHYARVRYQDERWQLLRGVDTKKDQSYVLYPLTQQQLSRLLLPVGEYRKPRIRELAAAANLANAQKPDSQDICFVPEGDYTVFLQRYGGITLEPGNFVDENGTVLGRHRGQACYTAGQRRGLGISGGRPLYVVRKDAAANTVVLGDASSLYSTQVWAEDFNWVSLPPRENAIPVTAKTRYTQQDSRATLHPLGDGRVRLDFENPQRAVTTGQAVVVYQGELVVGGGTITQAG